MPQLNLLKLQDVSTGAQYLLGAQIVRTLPSGEQLIVKVVETEAYHQRDPASHTFRGRTARTTAMFGPAGHAYIYFTYGMHWCFNVTAGLNGEGAGILIRAGEPLEGVATMQRLRNTLNLTNLSNGPGKLAQALAIDKTLYGHDLSQPPLQVIPAASPPKKITRTTRIGITKAVDELARFYIAGNPYVSRQ